MKFDVVMFGNFNVPKDMLVSSRGELFSDSVEPNFGTGGASRQIYKDCVNDYVDVSSRSYYIINAASTCISSFYFLEFHSDSMAMTHKSIGIQTHNTLQQTMIALVDAISAG